MTARERLRNLVRPVGQATMYFVFVIAIVEFLKRERVVTHAIFTTRTVVVAGLQATLSKRRKAQPLILPPKQKKP